MKLHDRVNMRDENGSFILAPLPYLPDDLWPQIGERTVRYHYYKHLQAYIDNVNRLKKGGETIEELINNNRRLRNSLFLNASQVYNHYCYFEQLSSRGTKQPLPMMQNLIEREYETWEKLRSQIADAAMSIFGSGWVFLTRAINGAFSIHTYTGTDTPLDEDILIALDVWEHAYYLDYQNSRKAYIDEFFDLIDWEIIENRLKLR